jgi:uncharacterized protein (DUF433 family)
MLETDKKSAITKRGGELFDHAARPFVEAAMQKQLILFDPNVMMGKPIIAGTRITVELILQKLSASETIEQILDAHPRLTRKAIQAALAFAADVLRADVVYPIVVERAA